MIISKMTLLLGLDIGTTSLKAVLYDAARGEVVRIAVRPTPISHPREGWSEHDPLALWEATTACIREAAAGLPVAALAISSMAEAGLLIDSSGKPLSPIIAWYDRRSETQAAWIEQQIPVADLYRITGQRVSPSFGVTKLLWLRDNLPQAYSRGSFWLPVPSYLLWRLSGQLAVDYTIAARSLLFDQRSLDWSGQLLDLFQLPPAFFPPVHPGGTPIGTLTTQTAEETGLPRGTLCVLGGHDHLCAALAAGAHIPGSVTDSTGSANALLLLLPHFLPDPALAERGYASYAYVLNGRYALKGGLKAAGSAIEWLARLTSPENNLDYAQLEAAASQGIGSRAGPLWLPHLIGSGTPQGDRFSRAALIGLQAEHDRSDLFRGMLESLAMWTRHNLEEMHRLTLLDIASFALTGGVTRLKLLSQLKADVLNRSVLVPQVPEAAATGAALLAGLGAGAFTDPSQALASLHYACIQFDPLPQHAAWYDRLYQQVYLPLYSMLKPASEVLRQMDSMG
jgi:xylulokinase